MPAKKTETHKIDVQTECTPTDAKTAGPDDFKSLGAATIAHTTPVWVIATYDKTGRADAMTAAWAGIANSTPASVFVAIRPGRYTYENILERREFTVCIPSEEYATHADYFGIESGRETDKFEAAGLTPVRAGKVNAPYVAEFPMYLSCKLKDRMNLGSHFVIIGEIIDVRVQEKMLDSDGKIDLKKLKPLVYAPDSMKYFGVGDEIGQAFKIGKEFKKQKGDGEQK
ncbi:flavin reductase family protein [Methanolapillus millepedarum]|uniref:Flavoredoxin n=1 Tax=Methanolapillus millepedarum TaxID=3028296 RepID=A0AA96ZWL9_9EURY|nr:Flavoredoxin [Methanosarcinaceae archaeon Ac7]